MQTAMQQVNDPSFRIQSSFEALREDRIPHRLEALGMMTAGIVHDLGNIIQILSSTVELLDQHPTVMATASLQPPLRRAVGSVARAEALISQVLRFAQGQAMEQQSVDLKQCLTDMQPMLRWIADNTMRVDVQIDAEVPPLFCSRFDLEAAILNVALNAHEAMPGAGTLSITAIPLRSGQAIEGVAISIADTGRGMSPQTRSRAMEPFFTTNATGGGNGLGLAMVRRFAREAGGDVAIESQLGIGTTVTLRLPIGSKR